MIERNRKGLVDAINGGDEALAQHYFNELDKANYDFDSFRDPKKNSFLHLAIAKQMSFLFYALLEKNINRDAQNDKFATALDIAMDNGHDDL